VTAANTGAPTNDPFEFMRLLWALDHALQSRSKRMLSSLGVTGPQRLVIRAVGRRPGMSAGELAELLHLHPSTLTGVLSRLVEHRLLDRAGDPADSRRALFRLTARGRRVNRVNSGTVEGAVRRVIGGRSAGRVAAAAEILSALGTALATPRARRARDKGRPPGNGATRARRAAKHRNVRAV
jgi:DNA-binding MarR family transcriptional regulator